jgi:hypothetical protein
MVGLPFFTLDFINIIITECNTSYHHNYRVQNKTRYYYWGNLPDIIEVAEHHYVDRKLIDLWCTDMNVAWSVPL